MGRGHKGWDLSTFTNEGNECQNLRIAWRCRRGSKLLKTLQQPHWYPLNHQDNIPANETAQVRGLVKPATLYVMLIPISVGFQDLSQTALTNLSASMPVITAASSSTFWESLIFIIQNPLTSCSNSRHGLCSKTTCVGTPQHHWRATCSSGHLTSLCVSFPCVRRSKLNVP